MSEPYQYSKDIQQIRENMDAFHGDSLDKKSDDWVRLTPKMSDEYLQKIVDAKPSPRSANIPYHLDLLSRAIAGDKEALVQAGEKSVSAAELEYNTYAFMLIEEKVRYQLAVSELSRRKSLEQGIVMGATRQGKSYMKRPRFKMTLRKRDVNFDLKTPAEQAEHIKAFGELVDGLDVNKPIVAQFYSPKGGVGKSSPSMNEQVSLAWKKWAQSSGVKSEIIDFFVAHNDTADEVSSPMTIEFTTYEDKVKNMAASELSAQMESKLADIEKQEHKLHLLTRCLEVDEQPLAVEEINQLLDSDIWLEFYMSSVSGRKQSVSEKEEISFEIVETQDYIQQLKKEQEQLAIELMKRKRVQGLMSNARDVSATPLTDEEGPQAA